MLAAGVVALVLVVVARAVAAAGGSAESIVGQHAPAVSLPVEYGGFYFPETVSLSAQHGHPVLMTFFFTLCSHCLPELQTVQHAAQASAPQHLTTFYIDTPDEEPAVVEQFAARAGIHQSVLIDFGGKVATRYHITFFPTVLLIDGQGIVRHVWTGTPSAAAIEAQVRALPTSPGASR